MSAADNIAAVLGGKRNGSGWMARCPCHMDNNASLSISEGSDGKALLKCHAGCRQDELMARVRGMGLDLGGRRPASADVATYDYRDRNGTVRYRVVRRKPKRFLQCQPDGKSGSQPRASSSCATPAQTVILSGPVSKGTSSSSTICRTRSAMLSAASQGVSGNRIANSSPPMRASESC